MCYLGMQYLSFCLCKVDGGRPQLVMVLVMVDVSDELGYVGRSAVSGKVSYAVQPHEVCMEEQHQSSYRLINFFSDRIYEE